MKRKIYMHPSVKPRLNEFLAYMYSCLVIPVKDKENINGKSSENNKSESELNESLKD